MFLLVCLLLLLLLLLLRALLAVAAEPIVFEHGGEAYFGFLGERGVGGDGVLDPLFLRFF